MGQCGFLRRSLGVVLAAVDDLSGKWLASAAMTRQRVGEHMVQCAGHLVQLEGFD
jgi:hypothetical protein